MQRVAERQTGGGDAAPSPALKRYGFPFFCSLVCLIFAERPTVWITTACEPFAVTPVIQHDSFLVQPTPSRLSLTDRIAPALPLLKGTMTLPPENFCPTV